MEHSIEADGDGSVAVREPRRDLQTGSPIAASDDGLSPGQLKALGERRRHDPHLELPDERSSPRVHQNGGARSGRLHAEDDDRVTTGELLVEIDPRDYAVAAEQARAGLELAQARVASAKQDYAAALANTREDDAASFRAHRDNVRYAALLDQRVVAQEQYDQFHAIALVDAAKVDSAREAAGSALKAIAAREGELHAAKATLDQALLNLSYTKIYAPANGIVGKRAVQLGSRIQPGQTLMFVTETDDLWVTANFKETQLARMHHGEEVTIHVDTFGRNYRGHVEHMPGASGDRFSLLPPENATGNYVKVVQRLPVRILFEPGQDPGHLLHPGMSVEPTVWLQQSHKQ